MMSCHHQKNQNRYHHNKFLDHLRNDSNGTDHGDLYYDVDASGISLTAWSAQNGSNHTGNRTPAAAGIVADEYQWRLFNGTYRARFHQLYILLRALSNRMTRVGSKPSQRNPI